MADDTLTTPDLDPDAPAAAPKPPPGSNAALRAEVAALRKRLAEAEAGAAAKPPVDAGEYAPGRYRVDLLHAPSWVVDANGPSHAWTMYKRATGVIKSENEHQVARVGDDTPLGGVGPHYDERRRKEAEAAA